MTIFASLLLQCLLLKNPIILKCLQQDTTIFTNSPPNSAFVTGQYQVGRGIHSRPIHSGDYNGGWYHPQAQVQGSSDDGQGSQDIGSGDMGYFSRTSPNYSNINSNSGGSTQQTTPQTPTPNITISGNFITVDNLMPAWNNQDLFFADYSFMFWIAPTLSMISAICLHRLDLSWFLFLACKSIASVWLSDF